MKETIRSSVFETNSSSTHSLSICSREEYDKWRNGETVYCPGEERFESIEKVDKEKIYDVEKWDGDYYDEQDDLDISYLYWKYDDFFTDSCIYSTVEESAVVNGVNVLAISWYMPWG